MQFKLQWIIYPLIILIVITSGMLVYLKLQMLNTGISLKYEEYNAQLNWNSNLLDR